MQIKQNIPKEKKKYTRSRDSVLCWPTTPGRGLLWSVVDRHGDTSLEKLVFPFPACLTIADSFLVRVGFCRCPPPQCWDSGGLV